MASINKATIDSQFNLIFIGGESRTLSPTDFSFDEVTTENELDTVGYVTNTLPKGLNIKYDSTGRSLVITGLKHINSTSLVEDENNAAGNKNTSVEDNYSTSFLMTGAVYKESTKKFYDFEFYIYYFAAVHPPTLNVERIRTNLQSTTTSNAYSLIFTTAQPNVFSPVQPNKTVPHAASELIGYSRLYKPYFIDNVPDSLVIPWYLGSSITTATADIFTTVGKNSGITEILGVTISPVYAFSRNINYSFDLGTKAYTFTAKHNTQGVLNILTKNVTVTREAKQFSINSFGIGASDGVGRINYTALSSFLIDIEVTVYSTNYDYDPAPLKRHTYTLTGQQVTQGTNNLDFTLQLPQPAENNDVLLAYSAVLSFNGHYIDEVAYSHNTGGGTTDPDTLTVDPTSLTFYLSGGTQTVNVTSNYPDRWTIQSKPSWVTTVKPSTNDSLQITAVTNSSGSNRTGSVIIQSGVDSTTATINITQYGGIYLVTPASHICNVGDSSTQKITIQSTSSWTATATIQVAGSFQLLTTSGGAGETYLYLYSTGGTANQTLGYITFNNTDGLYSTTYIYKQ